MNLPFGSSIVRGYADILNLLATGLNSLFQRSVFPQVAVLCPITAGGDTCAFTIHALCLMTNHFHMCIETEDVEIWKIMHRLLLTYAANYNIKYKLTGHLFENRYIGQLIEDDRYFLEVSRYIHLNPVKAGMVREPLSYEYSSYGLYVAGEGTLQAEKA